MSAPVWQSELLNGRTAERVKKASPCDSYIRLQDKFYTQLKKLSTPNLLDYKMVKASDTTVRY